MKKLIYSFFTLSGNDNQSSRKTEKDAVSIFHHLHSVSGMFRFLIYLIGVVAAVLCGILLPFRGIFNAGAMSVFSDWATKRNLSDSASKDTTDDDMYESVAWFAYMYAWLGACVFFCSFLSIVIWEMVGLESVKKIRLNFFSHALRMDLKWHERLGKDNNINSCLTDDILKLKNNLGSKVALLISSVATLLSVVVVSLYLNLKLGALVLGGNCLIAICLVPAGKISTKLASREQAVQRELGFNAHEALTSIKVVKSFGCQSFELARFSSIASAVKAIANKKILVASIHIGISTILSYIFYSASIAYGGYLLANNEISPGNLIVTLICYTMGSFVFAYFLPLMSDVAEGVSSYANLLKLFDVIPEVDQESSEKNVVDHLLGDIDFKDVTFSYPSRLEWKVLDSLSMSIPYGKTVAIVGPSGAGKSSIINLILRLFDPETGKILVGGKDINSMNINTWRSKIGVVTQEPVLFDGTIEENIRLGNLNAAPEDIRNAAKQAHAHDFILSLPQAYSTIVGERGGKLSGGQKQRIAIARALVRNPDILLFDEATSALDNQSEKLVQQSMESVCQGKTSIIVAHRLSTIRHADMIFVLDNGRIAESGEHEELISRKGVYYTLYEQQKTHAEEYTAGKHQEGSACAKEDINTATKDENGQRQHTEREAWSLGMASQTLKNVVYLSKKGIFSAAVLFSILGGLTIPVFVIEFFLPFSLGALYRDTPQKVFYPLSLNLIYFAVIAAILIFLGAMTTSYSMEIAVENLRAGMFRSAIEQDLSFFDGENFTPIKVANVILEKPGQIRDIGGVKAGNALNCFVFILAASIGAIVWFWQLALILLVFVMVLIVSNYLQTRLKFCMQRESNINESNASKLVSMSLDNITTVYCLSLQRYVVSKYEDIITSRASQEWKDILLYATTFAISNSVSYFYVTAAFTFGTKRLLEGDATLSDMMLVPYILQVALGSVGSIVTYYQEAGRAKPAVDEAMYLMNLKVDRPSEPAKDCKLSISGAIDLKNIYFSYPNCSSPVLLGLSLHIKPGQTVAIVGRSGSGKSTIINLLQKFYFPSRGEILIDGQDISSLGTDQLRNVMGLVTQEPLLFNGSIRDNIMYGIKSQGHSVTEDDIVKCCRQANIHEFISSLPQGYDTEVGPRGARLSGGQKQRVAIARALIRDPKILLLDEATSALDAESEKEVQKAFSAAREGRTTIVVAHRLSTVQNADLIAVLESGVVVEQGTHDELMDFKGIYHSMTRK